MLVHRRHLTVSLVVVFAILATVAGYTVEPGDTLSQIASEHGVSTSAIAAENGITDPNRIWVGQLLSIPGGTTDSPSSAPDIYVVQPGETLGTIAARFGTTVSTIAELNGITNPNIVYAGTRLIMSGEAPPPPPVSSPTASTHTVAAGESLSVIAASYSMKTADLAALNAIENFDRIYIGQVLKVTGTSPGFACPVPGATFFNDWGFPRSGGRYHEGTDLFATRGTPVLAPTSGFLHQIEGTIGGIQFRLDGDDGHRYVGTHMDAFGAAGQVAQGQVIGYVGDSGNAVGSSPHLHFEIALNRDESVNPFPYLDGACR